MSMSEHDIPWWTPQVGQNEYANLRDVLESNYLNDGDVTTQFEQEIAKLVGATYAVGVTNGTSALFLALAALGIGHGDEVGVPDLTFIATANAVTLTGATPVLVDIDPATLTISPEAFEKAITADTRAVIPVHISGRSADLPAIVAIAKEHGLAVVEDAAEAFASFHDGRALGTIGIAGCLSFSPNKTIMTGQGGMVLTDDEGLHLRLRELKDQGRPVRGTGGDDPHPSVGFNFKLTNLHSAIGLGQLEYLTERLARQKRTYAQYARGLAGAPGVRLPGFDIDSGEVPLWVDAIVERRQELDRLLGDRRMHCRRFWAPLHTQPPYRCSDEEFPGSIWAAPRALWLPSAFTLSDTDVDAVIGAVREFVDLRNGT